jgi:hypothetical protein
MAIKNNNNCKFDFDSNNCDCQLFVDVFIVENKRKSLNKNANNSRPLET